MCAISRSTVVPSFGSLLQPWVGDVAHIVSLLSTVSFASCVYRYINVENDPIFDREWKEQGFCVANSNIPYWNSHDVCFYTDVALAALLAICFLMNRNMPGMELCNRLMGTNILGIIGHGIGHGMSGYMMRKIKVEESPEVAAEIENTLSDHLISIVFWTSLLKASMPNAGVATLLTATVGAILMQKPLPDNVQFTYVQTVLMIAFSVNQLLRPRHEKDLPYVLYSVLVSLPVSFIGWMESMFCSTFVKDLLYGHVAYDAYIPLAILVWYTLCLYVVSVQGPKAKIL